MGGKYSLGEFVDLLVSCSLYLNVNSVLIIVISGLFLGGGVLAGGLGIVTGTSLMTFVYLGDRLDVTDEDRINNPERTALVEKYRTELLVAAAAAIALFELSLIAAVFSPDLAGVATVALGHVPLLVLFFYDEIKTVRLPVDSLAVAFTWGYELVFVYVFISPLTVTPSDALVLFLGWFLIVFAGLEARNAEDIEGDRKAGKVTLAAIFGKRRTKYAETTLKAVGGGILVVASNSLAVFGLLVVHLLSLWWYGTLERDFRCGSTGVGAVEG